eukprot:SAG31_NODE_4055_length_3633_cov_1.566497_2_plen_509_part_00
MAIKNEKKRRSELTELFDRVNVSPPCTGQITASTPPLSPSRLMICVSLFCYTSVFVRTVMRRFFCGVGVQVAASSPCGKPASARFRILSLLLSHIANSAGVEELAMADAAGEAAMHVAARLIFYDLFTHNSTCECDRGLSDKSLSGSMDDDFLVLSEAAKGLSLLLEVGCPPDAPLDEQGWTPLHHAATAGQLACVELLLDAGADPTKKDRHGLTPADAAVRAVSAAGEEDNDTNGCLSSSKTKHVDSKPQREPEVAPVPQPMAQTQSAHGMEKNGECGAKKLNDLAAQLAELLRIYAPRQPINASILSARYMKMYGKALNPTEYGHDRMSSLLAAMPNTCHIRHEPPRGRRETAPKLVVQLAVASGGDIAASEPRTVMDGVSEDQVAWPNRSQYQAKAAERCAAAAKAHVSTGRVDSAARLRGGVELEMARVDLARYRAVNIKRTLVRSYSYYSARVRGSNWSLMSKCQLSRMACRVSTSIYHYRFCTPLLGLTIATTRQITAFYAQ